MADNFSGEDLRDAGMEAAIAADGAVHRGYREHIEAVLDALADHGLPFSADDVQRGLDDDTRRYAAPNLVGSLIGHYGRSGRLVHIGWTTSKRAARHAGAQRLWIGAQWATDGEVAA